MSADPELCAVMAGECILEWDPNKDDGPCPVPLLKDAFGGERRKAKVLNFSIAYGKTAHGLSKDWGTSLAEAEQTVKRWYDSRPEVCPCVHVPLSCAICCVHILNIHAMSSGFRMPHCWDAIWALML